MKSIFTESGRSAETRTTSNIALARALDLSRYCVTKIIMKLSLSSYQLPKHAYKRGGDMTYIWQGDKWCDLTVVMDLFSCKPVGWAVSNSPGSNLTGKALTMAFESRGLPKEVMFHSD